MRRGSVNWVGVCTACFIGLIVLAVIWSAHDEEMHRIKGPISFEPGNARVSELPQGSTDVKDLGNGWTRFTLEGHDFLYRRISDGYGNRNQLLIQMLDEESDDVAGNEAPGETVLGTRQEHRHP